MACECCAASEHGFSPLPLCSCCEINRIALTRNERKSQEGPISRTCSVEIVTCGPYIIMMCILLFSPPTPLPPTPSLRTPFPPDMVLFMSLHVYQYKRVFFLCTLLWFCFNVLVLLRLLVLFVSHALLPLLGLFSCLSSHHPPPSSLLFSFDWPGVFIFFVKWPGSLFVESSQLSRLLRTQNDSTCHVGDWLGLWFHWNLFLRVTDDDCFCDGWPLHYIKFVVQHVSDDMSRSVSLLAVLLPFYDLTGAWCQMLLFFFFFKVGIVTVQELFFVIIQKKKKKV